MGELKHIHLTVVQLQLQDVIELSAEHTLLPDATFFLQP